MLAKRILINISLSVIVVILFVFILEVCIKFTIDHPNSNNYFINNLGFRDNHTFTKPKNTYRILALGDSFTYGAVKKNEDTWPAMLEQILNKGDSSSKFEVINAGQVGFNTYDELSLYKDVGDYYKHDLIIIGYFLNDVGTYTDYIEFYEKNFIKIEGKFGVFLFQNFYSYKLLINNLNGFLVKIDLKKGYKDYLHNLYLKKENLKTLSDTVKEFKSITDNKKIELMVVIFPYFEDWEDYEFNKEQDIVKKILDKEKIIFLDLFSSYKYKNAQDYIIENNNFGYDPHPNINANMIAAKGINDFLTDKELIG